MHDIVPEQTPYPLLHKELFFTTLNEKTFYNDNKIGASFNNKNTLWRMGEKKRQHKETLEPAACLYPFSNTHNVRLREGTVEKRIRRIKNIAFPLKIVGAAYVHNIKIEQAAELPISCSADMYTQLRVQLISLLKAIVIGGVCECGNVEKN